MSQALALQHFRVFWDSTACHGWSLRTLHPCVPPQGMTTSPCDTCWHEHQWAMLVGAWLDQNQSCMHMPVPLPGSLLRWPKKWEQLHVRATRQRQACFLLLLSCCCKDCLSAEASSILKSCSFLLVIPSVTPETLLCGGRNPTPETLFLRIAEGKRASEGSVRSTLPTRAY